jgi:DNA-binding GntR family transcriptional regulator
VKVYAAAVALDPDDLRPLYAQIADYLRVEIAEGRLGPGEKLPRIQDIASQYGVANMTIQHALQRLRHLGLINSWQGRGSFVRDEPDIAEKARRAGSSLATGSERHHEGDGDDVTYEELAQQIKAITTNLRRIDERLTRIEQQVLPDER